MKEMIISGTEFHAESGSETHLFIEVLHPECTDFTGYLRQKNPMSDAVEEEMSNLNAEIEIQFKKTSSEWDVVIQPNPNNGQYKLAIETSETMTVQANLEIYSLTGNKVYSQVLNTKTTEMNISHLGKGIYIISILQNNNIVNKKLIIQ
ncbi:MAG: T9SS type A sorting domain-containing protein [Bacteroidia bacterium]|nr:T9SS type A sorting domain-containing protein [Bacteroidia bacterium]